MYDCESINSICRICLDESEQQMSLFEIENDIIYSDILKEHTGLLLYDKFDLPKGVCDLCFSELMTVINFFSKVRSSSEKLNYVLSWEIPVIFTNPVKLENAENVYNLSQPRLKLEKEDVQYKLDNPIANDKFIVNVDTNSSTTKEMVVSSETVAHTIINVRDSIHSNAAFNNFPESVNEPKKYNLRSYSKFSDISEDTNQSDDLFNEAASGTKKSSLVPLGFSEEGVEIVPGTDPRCLILKKCKERGLNKDVVKCLTCDLLSINHSAFLVHYRKHTGEKPHHCPHCETSFSQSGTLSTHLQRKHLKEWKKARLVTKKLKMSSEVKRLKQQASKTNGEISSVYDGNVKRFFICSVCGKTYYCRSSLTTHMRLHNADKQFQCSYCPQKFIQSGMRSLHTRVHHTGEKPYFCHICGKCFVASTALTKHLVSHSDERNFKCEICDKAMKSKDNLKRHILVMHTPAKRKVCHICGATFALTYKLNHHIKVWHINKKSGSCDICKKNFHNIEKHMKRHSNDKPFGCHMCHKTFFKQKNLFEHLKKHQNENAIFKCTYDNCTSVFSKKCVLDFHTLKYHLKHTPYVCQYCFRGFYRKRDLGKHVKLLHNVKLECSIMSNGLKSEDVSGCVTAI